MRKNKKVTIVLSIKEADELANILERQMLFIKYYAEASKLPLNLKISLQKRLKIIGDIYYKL